MDNVITNEIYESSSEESSSDEELLTSNIGVRYDVNYNENEKLINDRPKSEYESIRNKYFTPEVTKRRFTYNKLTVANVTINLSQEFGLETKNIIGFKLIKSGIINTASNGSHADLIIPEIPDIACMKNNTGESIIDRIPLYQNENSYYHYDDYKNDIYFTPISLNTLTLEFDKKGYLTFEITYLNL